MFFEYSSIFPILHVIAAHPNSLVPAPQIKRAKTDAHRGVSFDADARPEVANLLRVFAAVSGRAVDEICAEHAVRDRPAGYQPVCQSYSIIDVKTYKELRKVIISYFSLKYRNMLNNIRSEEICRAW
jgi:hypothetical protein